MSSHKLHPNTPNSFAYHRLDPRPHSRRSLTPNGRGLANSARLMNSIEGDLGAEDDPRLAVFRNLYNKSEARLASLFKEKEDDQAEDDGDLGGADTTAEGKPLAEATAQSKSLKRRRSIDEDDYGDESEGEDATESPNVSPLKSRSTLPPVNLPASLSMVRALSQTSNAASAKGTPIAGKTTEEARKKLEEDKKATEEAAKRTFHTLFYTLENDRDAMLEQKKLEELERKVDAELGAGGLNSTGTQEHVHHSTLSQTNLGASSLTLKNLIRRIDDQRDKVKAPDSELRSLMSEVRKNRSKWASEDKIGQEELYESVEKVLSELKGHTEHSTHFLNKVNKKEAPDYGNSKSLADRRMLSANINIVIKHPMDLGTMTKKLKNYSYKSKQDFTDDLDLIWANCLRYNAKPDHYMRKHALYMRKETEKLVPLIPDIIIRDKAEVEAQEKAEERRRQKSIAEFEGDEDSDDEPIMQSRGRKAPGKKSKKGTVARKAPAGNDGTDTISNGLKDEPKPDSEPLPEGSETPPHGNLTPTGINGILTHGAIGTQSDTMDVDNESMLNGLAPSIPDVSDEPEFEDVEYKTWKSVTKKDRAIITAERHRLFKGDGLDPEAPALLRTKAGMRSWLRKQRQAEADMTGSKPEKADQPQDESGQSKGETLAEGMEGDEEKVLPDYYDPLAALPEVSPRLEWAEDSEGNVVDPSDEFLREMPQGLWVAPRSALKRRIDDNIHQIQRTRKVTTKIGVVKQMAIQSQIYQGQFQKSEVVPLIEQDVDAHVMSDEGPVIAPAVSRAAMQRTIAQLLMHAGFEEFQPAALDAFTDMAGDYFNKLARTFVSYSEAELVPVTVPGKEAPVWKSRFSCEESILHTLQENGADLEALDTYVNEDIDRAGTRLNATHERMKAHLADLLRPALADSGDDPSASFNDNSEEFVSGNFAEQLGDDFFGFKELGLDIEFGDSSMSVPLHILQKSMYNANRGQDNS